MVGRAFLKISGPLIFIVLIVGCSEIRPLAPTIKSIEKQVNGVKVISLKSQERWIPFEDYTDIKCVYHKDTKPKDDAEIVGNCLFIFKEICPTEFLPSIKEVEVFSFSGNAQNLDPIASKLIYHLGQQFKTTKNGTNIALYSEEGVVSSVIFVMPNCEIKVTSLDDLNLYCYECVTKIIGEGLFVSKLEQRHEDPELPSSFVKLYIKNDAPIQIK